MKGTLFFYSQISTSCFHESVVFILRKIATFVKDN
jgi:hypothetical protein